jgi:hypothetical protein
MKSTLRLFRGLPVSHKENRKTNEDLLQQTIRKGFLFSPEVIANYPKSELFHLADTIEQEIGITPEQMNSSFHKSWDKIRDSSIIQLALEQMTHYITTYGFERLGMYNEDFVYIPKEDLDIPEVDLENIKLLVIKGYTKEELKEKVLRMLSSGIALAADTLTDIADVATWVGLTVDEVESIKNKEARVILYDYMGIVPKNPMEFLRYAIYKTTDTTLIIKSKELISSIKEHSNITVAGLFEKYENWYGLERLAEIFYRHKPIFLAFRTNSKLRHTINRIRRLAVRFHKPMKEDYLNTVTSKIKHGNKQRESLLVSELDKVNIFRKIRLAYALKFRTENHESILYRIRNGKSYATAFDFNSFEYAKDALDIVLDSIADSLKTKVENKKIYIPPYMHYTLPSTEKQFTGNFPSGSWVSVDKDIIFGINWNNINGHRIDLDLSLISADGNKFGWDGYYRRGDGDILFSGDMTDARGRNGASELFYVNKRNKGHIDNMIMFVNYFNYDPKVEVPFKIVVAHKNVVGEDFTKYMLDPNTVLSTANSTINKKQKVLGFVSLGEELRFYFAESYLGNVISSRNNEYVNHTRRYLFDFYSNSIGLAVALVLAGAQLVSSEEEAEIDLSPEKLEKDTILNLLV